MIPIMAIDPGESGAIVVKSGATLGVFKMPSSLLELKSLLESLKFQYPHVQCYIEKVGGHVEGNSAMRSVSFGYHVGTLHALMYALGIPYEEVMSVKWMSIFPERPRSLSRKQMAGMGKKLWQQENGKRKTARKNHIKDKVAKYFKAYYDVKVKLWNSDALGILMWAESKVQS
jgi:hypothetical protein